MKRQRGRGRKPSNPANRSFESNGPEVKIRGNASQIYDKYLQLARDASSSGDRVRAENLYQHAEHYYRIVLANQPKRDPNQDENAEGQDANAEGQPSAEGGDQPQQRRGRGRGRGRDRGGEQAHDPMDVVTPDGEASDSEDSEASSAASDEEDAPRRRTRRPRNEAQEGPADNSAEDALETASAAADDDGGDHGGDPSESAAA